MIDIEDTDKPSVLVVDDDRMIGAMLAVGMCNGGYNILQDESREQALGVTAEHVSAVAILGLGSMSPIMASVCR